MSRLQLKLATALQLGMASNFILPFLQCTVHLRNSVVRMQFHGDSRHEVFLCKASHKLEELSAVT